MLKRNSFLFRIINRASHVNEGEVEPCSLSFLIIFLLMGSYYILRPVRDALASDWTDAEVSFLWTMNFFISTFAVIIYGWAISKLFFKYIVPTIYGFFALSFLFFFILIELTAQNGIYTKAFYVWVSIYSLFNVSVFWSFMSDIYNSEQANRLFSIIGAGASAGAIFGPSIPTLFSEIIGTFQLMWITSLCILATIPLFLKLHRLKRTKLGNKKSDTWDDKSKIGGNPFKGFWDFIQNPYLRKIGLFIILYTSISTFLYFQQKNLLSSYSLAERSQILGGVDWIVNLLTFTIAFFATSRIVKKLGMPIALSIIPFIMSGGLLLLSVTSSLFITLGLQIFRRAGNYALTRPAREMLFTQVTREERFKAKPVIDVVVYRGGDMMTSWGFAFLTEGLAFGLGALAAIGSIIAGVWGVIGVYLGKTFKDRTSQ